MPASMMALACWMPLPKRYWKTGISRPLAFFSSAITSSTSASDPQSGFSQITCLPARSAAMIIGWCSIGGVQMSTTSMSPIASTLSKLASRPRDAELVGERVHLLGVDVAEDRDLELLGVRQVALGDVRLADAGADHRDVELFCHCCHTVPRFAHLLRGQRQLHRFVAPRLRHRRLGAVEDVGDQLAAIGPVDRGAVDALDALLVDEDQVVAAWLSGDIGVFPELDIALGTEDREAAVAPDAKALRA